MEQILSQNSQKDSTLPTSDPSLLASSRTLKEYISVVVICYDSLGKLVHLFIKALFLSPTELYKASCFIFFQPIKTYLS